MQNKIKVVYTGAKMSKKSSKQVAVYKKSEDMSLSPAARLYHLRRETGVCVKCGASLDVSSKLLCTSHLDYYNTWHTSKRAKIAAALALLDESQKVEQTTAPEVVKTKAVKTSKKAK
jgi:hypothetical protein